MAYLTLYQCIIDVITNVKNVSDVIDVFDVVFDIVLFVVDGVYMIE